MSSLKEIFEARPAEARHSGKWEHYFEVYERHLARYREHHFTLLEIGVQNGGSIDVYREYFGRGLRYVGIDIDPAVREVTAPGATIEIGDSSDPAFLAACARRHGPFDVIIDDGSHVPTHQISAFEALYPTMRHDGVYVVEDLQTSYFPGYEGGGRYAGTTFLQHAQRLTDALHDHVYDDAYYAARLLQRGRGWLGRVEAELPRLGRSALWRRLRNRPTPRSDELRRVTRSVHFYPYLVVIERGSPPVMREVASGKRALGGKVLR